MTLCHVSLTASCGSGGTISCRQGVAEREPSLGLPGRQREREREAMGRICHSLHEKTNQNQYVKEKCGGAAYEWSSNEA